MKRSCQTRRRFLRTSAGGTAVVLAGCTGDSDGDEAHDGTETHEEKISLDSPSTSAAVDMAPQNHFEPHVVHVEVGGTVTWTNKGGNHSATAYHPDNDQPRRIPDAADSWDSRVFFGEGDTFEHTFEEPGVYDYYCTPHELVGMIGTVVVGTPDPADQPGLAPPSDDRSKPAATKIESLNETVRSALE